MDADDFKNVLDKRHIGYIFQNGTFTITGNFFVDLEKIETLPQKVIFDDKNQHVDLSDLLSLNPFVRFHNIEDVYLNSLNSISLGVEFNNGGGVYLYSLQKLPSRISFNNGGPIDLRSLETMSSKVRFNNGTDIYIRNIKSIPQGIKFNNGLGVSLDSLKSIPKNVHFNNGGYVFLGSLKSVSSGVEFNNGGFVNLGYFCDLPENSTINNGDVVFLEKSIIAINTPFLKRYRIPITANNEVVLYKRVSNEFKTQEGTTNLTAWIPGTTVTVKEWAPTLDECGYGKFHAVPFPHWADGFRNNPGDRYVAIKIKVPDLHEWTEYPVMYPNKIGFREGFVLYECTRDGKRVSN